MFATANGYVRRNALSDFGNVLANGKIAMKFEGEDADDRLIAVAICTEADDMLLATRNGQGNPLSGRRCARLHRPQLGRRARHPPARRRHGHLDVDPAPRGDRARDAQRLSKPRHAAPAADDEDSEAVAEPARA